MTKKSSPPLNSCTLLSREFLPDYHASKQRVGVYEEIIIRRLDYIIHFLFKTFNQRLDTWYFSGAGEGSMGDLIWDELEINVVTELIRNSKGGYDYADMVILDKNGSEWGFDSYIPTRWLFEDFEQEIVKGKALYEDRLKTKRAEENVKRQQKKTEATELVATAKRKLTKKELAALKEALSSTEEWRA